jgi:hypothetical protein
VRQGGIWISIAAGQRSTAISPIRALRPPTASRGRRRDIASLARFFLLSERRIYCPSNPTARRRRCTGSSRRQSRSSPIVQFFSLSLQPVVCNCLSLWRYLRLPHHTRYTRLSITHTHIPFFSSIHLHSQLFLLQRHAIIVIRRFKLPVLIRVCSNQLSLVNFTLSSINQVNTKYNSLIHHCEGQVRLHSIRSTCITIELDLCYPSLIT